MLLRVRLSVQIACRCTVPNIDNLPIFISVYEKSVNRRNLPHCCFWFVSVISEMYVVIKLSSLSLSLCVCVCVCVCVCETERAMRERVRERERERERTRESELRAAIIW